MLNGAERLTDWRGSGAFSQLNNEEWVQLLLVAITTRSEKEFSFPRNG